MSCACGCGQPTAIATKTRSVLGHVKGQPVKYARGHNGRLVAGQVPGRDPAQAGRHEAEKLYEIGGPCENGCGGIAVDRHHLDDDTTNNAPENVMRVCRRCHMLLDGRLERAAERLRVKEWR